MRALLLVITGAALAAVLPACGSSSTSSSTVASSSSTSSQSSSSSSASGGGAAAADCVFKVTFAGQSVNLAISGAGQAACGAFSAQFSAQASSSGSGLPSGTTITPGDVSSATGTPACTKDVGTIHFAVYTDSGNTSAAQSFCTGFLGSGAGSSSSSS